MLKIEVFLGRNLYGDTRAVDARVYEEEAAYTLALIAFDYALIFSVTKGRSE